MVPKRVFFTKGVGKHKDELQSFELALRGAGIEKCNLVRVSSIIPPKCKIVSKEKGIKALKAGEITYVVLSKNKTNEPNRLVGASVGVAIPKERESYGYISEHHCFGEASKRVGDY
ncbi:MAG: pyruvoyl-dependent arginine decarboxylase, partial [Alphaproteobacteria bacterium]